MTEDVSFKAGLRTGPKYLKGSKNAPSARVYTPVELSQQEWDIIHGDDPMSIFDYRGQKRRTGDPERVAALFSGKYVGKAWDVVQLIEECPQCGCLRGYNSGTSVVCLGCRVGLGKVHQYEQMAAEHFAKKEKEREKAEKKSAESTPKGTEAPAVEKQAAKKP